MKTRGWMALALSISLALASGSSGADGPSKRGPAPPRKILIELYTSQGCRSCSPASDLLGRLAKLGYGPDRVVALNFHVDDFNEPWVDPYSDPVACRRQRYYNEVLGRRDLAIAPLMIFDGRDPLTGSDRSAATASLARAAREPAGVSLELSLTGTGPRRSFSARIAGRSPVVDGRELLVGVALAEDPVTTRVGSGENAGRTLVEHQVVRRFAQKPLRLDQARPQTLTFPVELVEGQEPGRSRVTAFVQDRLDGVVYQAESILWPPDEPARVLALRRKKPRPKATNGTFLMSFDFSATSSLDDLSSCPDCGTSLSSEYLASLPPGFSFPNRFHFPDIPPPKC